MNIGLDTFFLANSICVIWLYKWVLYVHGLIHFINPNAATFLIFKTDAWTGELKECNDGICSVLGLEE